MSESTGSRSKMICGEMFVFCSSLLVSLTFGVSCQRSRLSEIRWLNVKQPTSTRLRLERDRTRSQVKLIMSESFAFCSSLSVSLASGIGHECVELSSTGLDPALSFRTRRRRRLRPQLERALARSGLARGSSTSSTQAPARSGSGSNNHMHEMCRVLRLISASAHLGDLSKRPARPELSESRSPPLRPELRAFGQHSERS